MNGRRWPSKEAGKSRRIECWRQTGRMPNKERARKNVATKMTLSDAQLRLLMAAEGCDCSDRQWERRGEHCTKHWIRCNGRMKWKRHNDPEFQRALAQLGHSHPSHDKRNTKSPPCPDCKQFLDALSQES